MTRIEEIEQRLSKIKEEMNAEGADLDALTTEAQTLIAERTAIEEKETRRSNLLAMIANGTAGTPASPLEPKNNLDGQVTSEERRAKEFAKTNRMSFDTGETRAVLLSSGDLATPTKVSSINDLMGGNYSIVDMVAVENCHGMSADVVPYVTSESEASEGTEGTAAAESEPKFGKITITPTYYNLSSYVSKQIQNQTPLDYATKVQNSAFKALRAKAAKAITDAIKKSEIADEITTITKIDANTLRMIAMSYGPDDEILGNCVLMLSKADLIAFGDVRGTNEKKAVYEITPDTANPDTGIIKDGGLSVKYVINKYCDSLTGGTNDSTSATKPTMLYGQPQAIKLDLFSQYTVSTSTDYKFAEGLLAVLGEVTLGTDVTVKGGMLKISLPAKAG